MAQIDIKKDVRGYSELKLIEDDQNGYIKTDESIIDEDYESTDPEYKRIKAYKLKYAVLWQDNETSTNPDTEIFSKIEDAYNDAQIEGGWWNGNIDHIKRIELLFTECWLNSDGEEYEETKNTIGYDDFVSETGIKFGFLNQYDGNSIYFKDFGKRDSNSNELLENTYFNLGKDLSGEFLAGNHKWYKITYTKPSKYSKLYIEDLNGNILDSIELRISDHAYNPANNTDDAMDGKFMSIEIANVNATKDRFHGKYSLQFDGEDKYEDILQKANERLDEILFSIDFDELGAKNNFAYGGEIEEIIKPMDTQLIVIEPAIEEVLRALQKRGSRALIVGGAVRDAIMKIEPKDIDIEVYNINYEDLTNILSKYGRVDLVGKNFGVIKFKPKDALMEYDFSVPRRENKVGTNHKEFEVTFDITMTIKDAAERRDFTFNALAYNPLTNIIYDYYGGLKDIENKIIRHTSLKFKEDALRILRAMQFQARFGFAIHPDTIEIMRDMLATTKDYAELPKERIFEEWMKWAEKGVHHDLIFKFLRNTTLIDYYPMLKLLKETPQDPIYHPEGDVEIHTTLCLNFMDKILKSRGITSGNEKVVLVMSILLHDIAKPETTEEKFKNGRITITSEGHEEQGGVKSKIFLEEIGFHESLIQPISALVANHLAGVNIYNIPERKGKLKAVKKLSNRLQPANIAQLLMVMEADHNGRGSDVYKDPTGSKELYEMANELNVEEKPYEYILMGRHLIEIGLKPSKEFGQILAASKEAQENGEFDNLIDAKLWLNRHLEEREAGKMEVGGQISNEITPDDILIVNANLEDIKHPADFIDQGNYKKYAKEVFNLFNALNQHPVIVAGEVSLIEANELGKKLGFSVKYSRRRDAGVTADQIQVPSIIDISALIYKIGLQYKIVANYDGIGAELAYADNINALNSESGDVVFAENFMNYFMAPYYQANLRPELYMELDEKIDPIYKIHINELIHQFAPNDDDDDNNPDKKKYGGLLFREDKYGKKQTDTWRFNVDDVFKDWLNNYDGSDVYKIRDFEKWLKDHSDDYVYMYHGTSADIPVMDEGLKKTRANTKKSLQSATGHVSVSIYPEMARVFGEIAYPGKKINIYQIDVRIGDLKPDKDQLKNHRLWSGLDVSDNLASSIVVGHGAWIDKNILPYELSLYKQEMADGGEADDFFMTEIKKIVEKEKLNTEGDYVQLYHGTSQANFRKILKSNKLLSDTWLAKDLETARKYGTMAISSGSPAVTPMMVYMGALYYNGYFSTREELYYEEGFYKPKRLLKFTKA